MSDKDAVTKDFMQDRETFADAFNFFVYGGRKVIDPEQLTPMDTSSVVLPYDGAGSPVPAQKYRDVIKLAALMRGPEAEYLLLGIENQSQVNYAMPVRNLLYDAMQYASQVNETARLHKKDGVYGNNAEYLSGFHKTDRLIPVITLTIYFGAEVWDAPRSLHDMLSVSVNDDMAVSFISDYKMNLLVPAEIEDGDFPKFSSELSQALKFIKYSRDKLKLRQIVEEDPGYRAVSKRTADMLSVVTGSGLKYNEGEERVDMCKAIDDMREEARAEGREAGIEIGREEGIGIGSIRMLAGLVKDEILTLADAAKRINLTVPEFEAKAGLEA